MIVSLEVFTAAGQLAKALGPDFTGDIQIHVHRGGVRRIELMPKRVPLVNEGSRATLDPVRRKP
jgi:hypothetical protein